MDALLLLIPGASATWSSGIVHMWTDANHVENLAGLSKVESSRPELSTAAEAAMSRRGMGVVRCLGSSEPADCQSYKAEKCTDITVPVCGRHTQVASSCKAQEEINMVQEAVPATITSPVRRLKRESSAKIYRRQARCWSGLMVPGLGNQCRACRCLLVLVH